MDTQSAAVAGGAVALTLTLATVGQIILAAAGCFLMFFIVRALVQHSSRLGQKTWEKSKSFFREVKQEADSIRKTGS